MKWKILAISSTSALVVALLCAGIYFRGGGFPFIGLRPEAPTVVNEIQRLNQLTTVKYTLQRVVGLTEPKTPFGEESILIMVQGEALAGVDLTCVSSADIQFTTARSVTVNLPRAKLLNVFLDEKQTKVWDRHITWWTPWIPYDPDLEHRARLKALDNVRSAALELGILNEAQRNAQLTVANFLRAVGLECKFPGT
jgi:hypothetical protein